MQLNADSLSCASGNISGTGDAEKKEPQLLTHYRQVGKLVKVMRAKKSKQEEASQRK